jgi:hypothetical protein
LAWKFENGWVSMRDPEWALSRALTVPSDKLLTLRDRLVGPFSLDNAGIAFSGLTDLQASVYILQNWVQRCWGLTLRDNHGCLPLIRFWHDLAPAQKSGLLGGRPIFGNGLSAKQKSLLWDQFAADERLFDYVSTDPVLDPEDEAWKLDNWPSSDFRQDNEITEIFPGGFPPEGAVRLRVSKAQAMLFSRAEGDWSMKLNAGDAITSGYLFSDREKFPMQLMDQHRAYFSFDLAPGYRRGSAIQGFDPPTEKVYKEVGDLPEELAKKLREAKGKRSGGE